MFSTKHDLLSVINQLSSVLLVFDDAHAIYTELAISRQLFIVGWSFIRPIRSILCIGYMYRHIVQYISL